MNNSKSCMNYGLDRKSATVAMNDRSTRRFRWFFEYLPPQSFMTVGSQPSFSSLIHASPQDCRNEDLTIFIDVEWPRRDPFESFKFLELHLEPQSVSSPPRTGVCLSCTPNTCRAYLSISTKCCYGCSSRGWSSVRDLSAMEGKWLAGL